MLRTIGPHIVHVHGEYNPDNWWPPKLWSCPLVLSPHGAFHHSVRARGTTRKRVYNRAAARLLYQHVWLFHALNPSELADIQAVWPRARAYCAPQGPSASVRLSAKSRLTDHRDRAEPVRFLFVGRLDVRTKGLDVLLQAFERATRLGTRQIPAVLTLVGPDWRGGRSEIERQIRRLGLVDSVVLGEAVNGADVPALYDDCDVFVQLSRHEGNPLSLNDALVLGKPAIVSDRVGTVSYDEIARLRHVQVVQPTVTSAAGAISHAVTDIDALTLIAEEARADLEKFLSWDRVAREHLRVYDSLLGHPAEPPLSHPLGSS